MLAKTTMQEIQDLKLQGYTKADITRYYEAMGVKPPSRPTINKYYDMDVIPDDPGAKLAKEHSFDMEPFRSTIIRILETNSGKHFCMSSVYDVLEEKFIENGNYVCLPGNAQTLRNYIHYLKDSGQINLEPGHQRVYDYVFDTPPGEQMLIDFGEETLSKNSSVHFICLLLRYSRMLCVYAQDHKFNSTEACQAIYRSFCKLGGRPKELVIDQDAVFVTSETYGEVIKTRVFEDFCAEQDLKLWVCNKHDPESKGPIENSVGFVKKNFFSARNITCIDDVWRSLPGWLERKNRRIHRTTLRIPCEVYERTEKAALRPMLPSVYETSPNTFRSYEIAAIPYVLYKSSKYSVPRDYAFRTVQFKVVGGKIHIYDENLNYICSHNLSERKGSVNQLPEHRKQESGDWVEIMERLRSKWNCYDFQHFINGFKKENPRHISKQLGAVERFLDRENPDKALVAQVMKQCCKDYRYQFSQFREVYELAKAGWDVSTNDGRALVSTGNVEYTDLSVYARAFKDRTAGKEVSA
ncbi:MAG: DDE-type integrase/transposase/recombinase [Clostridiales bacterium]|nr:DDE-type integrase/transposase/recombinase [Clostridiales bacterium]